MKFRERISIFIDFPNLSGSWKRAFGKKPKEHIPEDGWSYLNSSLLTLYSLTSRVPLKKLDHKITHICYPLLDDDSRSKHEYNFYKKVVSLSTEYGYVWKAQPKGLVENSYTSHLKEKGVDSFIVCQLMIGAKKGLYDTAILVSNDNDYVPAVEIVQNKYKCKVIQGAYIDLMAENAYLRGICYGHIDFNKLNEKFQLI